MKESVGISVRGKLLVGLIATAAIALSFATSAQAGISALTARGSVEQVQVTGATPGAQVDLTRKGKEISSKPAGSLGGAVFRNIEPGSGYTVASQGTVTPKLTVMTAKSAPPSTDIYDQDLQEGYGYLTTRDGTKLAIDVHLPGPAEDGPYPTLIEYSGYGYANPAGPQSGIQPVAALLGYAVVDINMRGSGCSGGAFDYFETLQSLDGYDAIETVARQPWVLHNKVGMLGISYGGISQLFVAATRPPSLSAITPLSVIDNTQTTLYPGGILNTGFALAWGQDRVDDSQPASPTTGQGWAWTRIQNGDTICAENQDLHPEATNLLKKIGHNKFYKPKVADPLSPITFVHKIDVPVYMACQWTDEQTGGHCPTLVKQMTGTDKKWFTFTNGVHTDSLDPESFNRWYDFMQLYIAKQKPELTDGQKAFAPVLYGSVLGVPGVTLPDDPIQDEPDFASAKAAFEDIPPVRILMDNGAGNAPGAPGPGYEKSYKSFPPSSNTATSWYLGRNGKLTSKAGGNGADQFTWDAAARPATNFTGNTGSGDLWTAHPNYQWSQNPDGKALSYVTPPLAKDTTVLGAGELQVWVRSQAKNVDLQATVTEVRPDDKETFVQGGWLRTDARKLDKAKSSLTEPVPSLRKKDVETLPKGKFVKVRIPLYYQGHVYREGSRIRVILSAPGGDQPTWAFGETGTDPEGTPWVAVAHSKKMASRLVLPVAKDGDAPTALPECPALRGEPCRDYEPFTNETFSAP